MILSYLVLWYHQFIEKFIKHTIVHDTKAFDDKKIKNEFFIKNSKYKKIHT